MSTSTSPNSANPTPTFDVSDLALAWRRGLTPPPRLNVVEWAEKFRKLSPESSNGGRFITSRVEVSRGPMLAATEPGVKTVTLMACTQLLKTTVIENVIGRFAHLDPCPMLVIQPKDDAAETFSKDRLAPMIRDAPVLRQLFGDAKATDASATLTHKQFPGGHITLVGSNSPTNLAMRPIRLLLCDEIDKYPLSAGGEGPPIDLAEERQAEFATNSLTYRACSPTIQGRSAIETSYEESDQRRAFVACPHCKGQQHLAWEQVRFDKYESGKIRPETARYECIECEKPWTEAQRLTALKVITWRQTRRFDCCGLQQIPETWDTAGRALCSECGAQAVTNEHAGFHASKLYAPKQSLRDTVKKFARALARGPEALKTFHNTQLAATWKEGADAPEWKDVLARRDRYRSGEVPGGGLILFGGVDAQRDRLEVRIWAFGRNRERWLVERRILPGAVYQPQVWADLEELFEHTWPHESGAEMKVRDWGVDSGAFTAEVAAFVRSQQGLGNVHAVDGVDSYTSAFIGVGQTDADHKGKKVRRGLKTLRIGVSFCKQELLGAFALPRPAGSDPFPPGFVHLPDDVGEDEVKQLTSEELRTTTLRGRTRRSWEVIAGRRNEGLDCANYARGLAAMRGWDRWREKQWREIEASLGIKSDVEKAVETQLQAPAPAGVLRQRGQRGVIRSRFMR